MAKTNNTEVTDVKDLSPAIDKIVNNRSTFDRMLNLGSLVKRNVDRMQISINTSNTIGSDSNQLSQNFKIISKQISAITTALVKSDKRITVVEKSVSDRLGQVSKLISDQTRKVALQVDNRIDSVESSINIFDDRIETHDRQIDRANADIALLKKQIAEKKTEKPLGRNNQPSNIDRESKSLTGSSLLAGAKSLTDSVVKGVTATGALAVAATRLGLPVAIAAGVSKLAVDYDQISSASSIEAIRTRWKTDGFNLLEQLTFGGPYTWEPARIKAEKYLQRLQQSTNDLRRQQDLEKYDNSADREDWMMSGPKGRGKNRKDIPSIDVHRKTQEYNRLRMKIPPVKAGFELPDVSWLWSNKSDDKKLAELNDINISSNQKVSIQSKNDVVVKARREISFQSDNIIKLTAKTIHLDADNIVLRNAAQTQIAQTAPRSIKDRALTAPQFQSALMQRQGEVFQQSKQPQMGIWDSFAKTLGLSPRRSAGGGSGGGSGVSSGTSGASGSAPDSTGYGNIPPGSWAPSGSKGNVSTKGLVRDWANTPESIIVKANANDPNITSTMIDDALKMKGVHEVKDRALIKQYLKEGGVNLDPKSTAWCAAFVNSTLQQHGIKGSGSMVASNFANWGQAVEWKDIKKGDVLYRGTPGQTGGHVGFFTGNIKDGKYEMYGGNQGRLKGEGSSTLASTQWISPGSYTPRRAIIDKEHLLDVTGNIVSSPITEQSSSDVSNMSPKQQMFNKMYQAAKQAGSPDPRLTAAIAMNESGWGSSRMFKQGNNPFGQTVTMRQVKEGAGGVSNYTIGADGQPHAVYPDTTTAVKHHLDKWGKYYDSSNPSQSLQNLIGAGYNTATPSWGPTINSIYNANMPAEVPQPTKPVEQIAQSLKKRKQKQFTMGGGGSFDLNKAFMKEKDPLSGSLASQALSNPNKKVFDVYNNTKDAATLNDIKKRMPAITADTTLTEAATKLSTVQQSASGGKTYNVSDVLLRDRMKKQKSATERFKPKPKAGSTAFWGGEKSKAKKPEKSIRDYVHSKDKAKTAAANDKAKKEAPKGASQNEKPNSTEATGGDKVKSKKESSVASTGGGDNLRVPSNNRADSAPPSPGTDGSGDYKHCLI